MTGDFPRILTLLRKEKGISQKQAAADLSISQALLSHYEKGIRECGLEFLVRCADYYGVSCDYLLGRSPDRNGATLTVDDIPDVDVNVKDNTYKGSILVTLNKKLIINTLNILFNILQKCGNKTLTSEISSYLMLACYKMFRVVYSGNHKNQTTLFSVPYQVSQHYASSAISVAEAKAVCVTSDIAFEGVEPLRSQDSLYMTTESLSADYPQAASSLLNLVKNVEGKIAPRDEKKK